MTTTEPRIVSITIVRKIDDSPDTSYLGEYSNNPGPHALNRRKRGDMGHGEYLYFNPAEHYETRKDRESAYKRAESLNRGDWGYIGIYATAEVCITGNVVQTIRSGGLWGIESDSDAEYLASIEREELDTLRGELEAIGCTEEQIADAIENAERDE